jgi:hypothetical protein
MPPLSLHKSLIIEPKLQFQLHIHLTMRIILYKLRRRFSRIFFKHSVEVSHIVETTMIAAFRNRSVLRHQ